MENLYSSTENLYTDRSVSDDPKFYRKDDARKQVSMYDNPLTYQIKKNPLSGLDEKMRKSYLSDTAQIIIYVGQEEDELPQNLYELNIECWVFQDPFLAYVKCLSNAYSKKNTPYAFICREDLPNKEAYKFMSDLQKCPTLKTVPCILLNPNNAVINKKAVKKAGADDLYSGTFKVEDMLDRIQFLQETKSLNSKEGKSIPPQPDLRISIAKRLFDIFLSSFALLILSPVWLLVLVLIKLESPGPIFYISKRVGTGYRIFNFYKFRSMRQDADKLMKDLMHLNQYDSTSDTTFVKIDNDPRITRIGKFIRKTSLDELPQLFNVLKGDMSIVGNRPLPLYEAERITKDLWSKRFLAPAGITGLWQVTKRGKKEMSVEERIALDMSYADNCTLWHDLKIVAQTFPALLQKESV